MISPGTRIGMPGGYTVIISEHILPSDSFIVTNLFLSKKASLGVIATLLSNTGSCISSMDVSLSWFSVNAISSKAETSLFKSSLLSPMLTITSI